MKTEDWATFIHAGECAIVAVIVLVVLLVTQKKAIAELLGRLKGVEWSNGKLKVSSEKRITKVEADIAEVKASRPKRVRAKTRDSISSEMEGFGHGPLAD